MAFDIKTLQQGNRIIGISSGDDTNLGRIEAGRIGGSFAWWLAQKVQKNNWDLNICVGYDSRLSAPALREGIMTGFQMFGAHHFDARISTTAGMAFAPKLPVYEYDAAVMITAGDMPGNMNGFRFFTAEGEVSEDDIAKILGYAAKYVFVGEWYETEKTNVMDMYAAHLRRAVTEGMGGGKLDGMHIVVDASNGSAGMFANKVLSQLGADLTGSQFLEPDGNFPGHEPNPDNEDAQQSLAKAVLDNKADIGILFSSDGDKVAVIDSDGNVVSRNEIFHVDEDAAMQAIRKIVAVAKLK